MNSKYSSFLTVLLVIVIIAIVGILGFLGYRYYESVRTKNTSEDFVDTFLNDSNKDTNTTDQNTVSDDEWNVNVDGTNNTGSSASNVQKYEGFTVAGTIEIPATNLKCPIIARSEYSKSALEKSVVEVYGVGLNQVGNTTIAGHNYRNGNFFSNNKRLNTGDKIYITDLTGKRVAYTIYSKYETTESDAEYMSRDTQGAVEISLSTCTDDSKARLIILARADG